MAKRSKTSGKSKKGRSDAKGSAESIQKPDLKAESSDRSTTGLKRKHFLIITIAVIVVVELLIVSGLRERYTISRHRKLAEANMKQKNFEKAADHWEALLEIAPRSASVNRGAGMTYYNLGQYDKAIQALQNVLNVNSSLEGINSQIGICYVEMDQPGKALPFFEQELTIDPTNPDANFYVGKHYYDQGDLRSAVLYFQAVGNHWRYVKRVKKYIAAINEDILKGVKARENKESGLEKENKE